MKKTLIIGYGNPDRQDDGVAWHILTSLAGRLSQPIPPSVDEGFPPSDENPELVFLLQLTPEMSEKVAAVDRVCFIDAHTGNVPEDVHFETLNPEFQTSPFTHHLTPSSCLFLAQTLYGKTPEAILVSVRGYKFGFSHDLSPETASHMEQAVSRVMAWLREDEAGLNHTNLVL